jgi:hypothetical protein
MMKRELFLACLLSTAVAGIACDDDEELPDWTVRDGGGRPATVDARIADAGAVDAAIADARIADSAAETAIPPDAGADAGVDAGPDAGTTPSWAAVYSQVITPRCLPCHSAATELGVTLGRLDMSTQATAFTNLVNAAAAGPACTAGGVRVVPGSPATSLLYLKVSPDEPVPCGAKMPLGGTITAAEADQIEAWILGGAPNN